MKIQDRTEKAGVRGTNGTDENLFQYSATNDRLHEDGYRGSERFGAGRENQEFHEYMHDQGHVVGNGYSRNQAEVGQKIQSDIMFSKERPDFSEKRTSAFDTANKLLNSKIIGHLSHHQGKVEQMTDISKRVPDSTVAYSRATGEKPYQRARENSSFIRKDNSVLERRDYNRSNSRNKGWESYHNNGSALQK
jgi:hypothetical protein